MKCPNCKTSNASDNRFCGACGAALTDVVDDVQAFLRDEFPRRIDRAIDTKLSAMTDREVIEVKATEQVINRIWTWVRRFAAVIGIPIVIFTSIIGFLGITTINDIGGLYKEIEKLRNDVKIDAAKIKAEASGSSLMVAQLQSQLEIANVAVGKVKALQVDAETVSGELARLKEGVEGVQEIKGDVGELIALVQHNDEEKKQEAENLKEEINKTVEEQIEENLEVINTRVEANEKVTAGIEETDLDAKIDLFSEAISKSDDFALAYIRRGHAYRQKRQLDLAIADFNKAIEFEPDNASTYRSRGLVRLALGSFEDARSDLAESLRRDPKNAYAVLWAYIVSAREGESDLQALRANADNLDPEEWPFPLVSMFLGDNQGTEAVRSALETSAIDDLNRGCDAEFYSGELRQIEDRQEEAVVHLQAAAKMCPQASIEYWFSKLELEL